MTLRPFQVELADANEFVDRHHRHHGPVLNHRFSLGVSCDGRLCGVAIVGRPVARAINKRQVVEVLRCCTDGTHNACSFLYGRAARIASLLGYLKIITYTLETEHGASLRACGFTLAATTKGGDWNCNVRTGRRTDQPMGPKGRWERELRLLTPEEEADLDHRERQDSPLFQAKSGGAA